MNSSPSLSISKLNHLSCSSSGTAFGVPGSYDGKSAPSAAIEDFVSVRPWSADLATDRKAVQPIFP
jgi:hypothetical protein